jgi:ribose transport system ATP-binding protein
MLVEIEHLSKTFPGQRALSNVSFGIADQEIHALVGENGSGKSTLIKVLAAFHQPDLGARILVAGEELHPGVASDPKRLGLRFVHQDLGLVDQLSAAENVGLASGFTTGAGGRIAWSAQQRHASELLARIGVELDVSLPVADLRPVQRSAVAIARALDSAHGEIRLLVLDEPTAALPPAEVAVLLRVLREVVAEGVSILYVSHRLDEVLGLSDRITVLRDGRCQGTFGARAMSRQRLIQLIVGKEVEEVMARDTRARDEDSTSPVLMRIRGLAGEALRGVDIDVRRGEVLGIAGLTGSGREELAAAISGAAPAMLTLTDDQGRVWDRMTPKLAKKLGIALVLANRHPASAIDQFTIKENLTLPRLSSYILHGRVNGAGERRAVAELIEDLDVRPAEPDRLYTYLSGGNKQKVIIAKWLNTHPNLIVMDDPTSGVDVGARHAIYQIIRERASAGASFLICSSDFDDFVGICDRVIALVSGRVGGELVGAQIEEGALLEAIVKTAGEPAERLGAR